MKKYTLLQERIRTGGGINPNPNPPPARSYALLLVTIARNTWEVTVKPQFIATLARRGLSLSSEVR